jgi:hypothetical protein
MAGRLLAIGVVVVTALLLAASGTPRAIKEGGTFRVAVLAGFFDTIDPASSVTPSSYSSWSRPAEP